MRQFKRTRPWAVQLPHRFCCASLPRTRASADPWRSSRRPVTIEPSYAPAWALLAQLHGSTTRDAPRVEVQQRTRVALQEAERAIALESDYKGGYAARAYARGWLLWDWKGAQSDLEHARALNSRSADVLSNYAGLMQKLGRLKEAIAVQRKVVEINPLDAE